MLYIIINLANSIQLNSILFYSIIKSHVVIILIRSSDFISCPGDTEVKNIMANLIVDFFFTVFIFNEIFSVQLIYLLEGY